MAYQRRFLSGFSPLATTGDYSGFTHKGQMAAIDTLCYLANEIFGENEILGNLALKGLKAYSVSHTQVVILN